MINSSSNYQELHMNIRALHFNTTGQSKLVALPLLLASLVAQATDLSNIPLTTSTATAMRPNIMFVLDDSGSMASRFMPDIIVDSSSGNHPPLCRNYTNTNQGWAAKQCQESDPPFNSAQFNGIYYNPSFTYQPPVNADGTLKANQLI